MILVIEKTLLFYSTKRKPKIENKIQEVINCENKLFSPIGLNILFLDNKNL
jgi:hypothetical protein